MGLIIPEERRENKWVDGIAIWIAVALVSLVGKLKSISLSYNITQSFVWYTNLRVIVFT